MAAQSPYNRLTSVDVDMKELVGAVADAIAEAFVLEVTGKGDDLKVELKVNGEAMDELVTASIINLPLININTSNEGAPDARAVGDLIERPGGMIVFRKLDLRPITTIDDSAADAHRRGQAEWEEQRVSSANLARTGGENSIQPSSTPGPPVDGGPAPVPARRPRRSRTATTASS